MHTGDRTLVGASPEVHVRASGGTVVMNPISGTYRYPAEGPTPEHLLEFLADGKEIEELSMVVDEELKMMCTVGDMGGVVVGPRLKEMAHLAHTEYELRGRSSLDVREVLKETTALVVAHRPSTVMLADRVALLSGGRIAAVGTHQELLRSSAEYAWLMSGEGDEER